MDGWVNGWVNGWVGGWADEWVDGGLMNGCFILHVVSEKIDWIRVEKVFVKSIVKHIQTKQFKIKCKKNGL